MSSSVGPSTGASAAQDPPYPSTGYAWYVVGVLMIAYTFSFIDRQILALLSGLVIKDLQLTDTQYGLLAGFAFALFYTFLGIPIGRLADRHSRRGIIITGITVWSLMTAVCGLSKNFWHLFLARMGVGVGEAALSPPAYSLISDYFPPNRLATALGAYGMGIYIGSGLAFIVGGGVIALVADVTVMLPVVGELRGWQIAFIAVGLPGLLVALLMYTVKEPYRRGVKRTGPDGAIESIPIAEVLAFVRTRWKAFGAHFLGFAPLSLIGYGAAAWTPEFIERTYGADLGGMGFFFTEQVLRAEIGYIYGFAVLIFGPLGIVAGGALADRWRSAGIAHCYLRVGALAALVLIPINILTPLMPTAWLVYLLLVPGAFFGAMPFGVAPAAVQAITPNQMRAQVSALYLFTVNIIGLGLGPLVIGVLTDVVFQDPADLRYSLAIVGAVTGVWAAGLLIAGFKPYARCVAETKAEAAA